VKIVYALLVLCGIVAYCGFGLYVYNTPDTGNILGFFIFLAVWGTLLGGGGALSAETPQALAVIALIDILAFMPWIVRYIILTLS